MYQVWSHCYTVIGMKRCLNILTTKNDNRQQCNGIKYCLPCKTRKPLLILHNEYWEIPYNLVGIRTVRLSGHLFSMMIHPKEHRPPFTLYLNSNLLQILIKQYSQLSLSIFTNNNVMMKTTMTTTLEKIILPFRGILKFRIVHEVKCIINFTPMQHFYLVIHVIFTGIIDYHFNAPLP